jgi:hypothetical protein
LGWGIDNNLTRKISTCDPVQIAAIKGLIAGSINTAIAFAQGAVFPAPKILMAAGLIGFISYGVSMVFFVLALRNLGTARTGAYFSIAPFVGGFLSLLLLHDTPSTALLISGLLMAVGVWLHLTEHHEHEHFHEPMAHEHPHVHDEHHQHAHTSEDPHGEPHTHWHRHEPLRHSHRHDPDIHHQHRH